MDNHKIEAAVVRLHQEIAQLIEDKDIESKRHIYEEVVSDYATLNGHYKRIIRDCLHDTPEQKEALEEHWKRLINLKVKLSQLLCT